MRKHTWKYNSCSRSHTCTDKCIYYIYIYIRKHTWKYNNCSRSHACTDKRREREMMRASERQEKALSKGRPLPTSTGPPDDLDLEWSKLMAVCVCVWYVCVCVCAGV